VCAGVHPTMGSSIDVLKAHAAVAIGHAAVVIGYAAEQKLGWNDGRSCEVRGSCNGPGSSAAGATETISLWPTARTCGADATHCERSTTIRIRDGGSQEKARWR
jgi:hypothetical protein